MWRIIALVSMILSVAALFCCAFLVKEIEVMHSRYDREISSLTKTTNHFGGIAMEDMTKLSREYIDLKEKVAVFESWTQLPTYDGRRATEQKPVLHFELKKLPIVTAEATDQ